MADPVTMAVISVGTTLLSSFATYQQGQAANRSAKYEALQMEQAAAKSRAEGARAAAEERRRSRIVQSNAIAAAASSGAGVSDPTVSNIVGDIAGEGEYRALTAGYEAESEAIGYENAAAGRRTEGKSAAQAGRIGAFGKLIQGGMSMYDKYGADLDPVGVSGGGRNYGTLPSGWRYGGRFN